MPRLFLLAALLVTTSACDSGDPGFTGLDGLSADASLLLGTWEWERSYTCGEGNTPCVETTPASERRTETLSFTGGVTGIGGVASGFFNGYTVQPTGYSVDAARRSIDLEDAGGYNEFGVSRDRLVITSAPVDGEETTYRRAR